jgi:hypothetical protein
MKKGLCFILVAVVALSCVSISTVISYIPGPGTQVAIVPDPTSTNGGTLPSSDAAYANFTFTNLPWVNVTAGNLTSYHIVVLVIDAGAPTPLLAPQQVTDLNNWVYNGGKLIIYDSEMPAVNYTWLPYPFTTSNPGAAGASGQPVTYLEDNTLGDSNPASYYYINTDQGPGNVWSDAIGDANVFLSYDIHWCGDIEAENILQTVGWVHTYAVYGDGLLIYNGLDIDPLGVGTVPSSIGVGNVAKIWLLELAQPWGSDYNLPCSRKVIPVGGEIITTPLIPTLLAVIAISILVATVTLLSKKLPRTTFKR